MNQKFYQNQHVSTNANAHYYADPYSLQPHPQHIMSNVQKQLQNQAKKINVLHKSFQENFYSYKEYYILSKRWFDRWKIYVSYEESIKDLPPTKFIGSGKIPQINQDIIDNNSIDIIFETPYEHLNVALREGLKLQVDYIIINKPMWQIFQNYQNIQIKRFLEKTHDGSKVQVYYRRVNAIYLFNSLLKEVERDQLKKFKKICIQLPLHVSMQTLIDLISPKIRQFAKNRCSTSGYITFDRQQNIRFWTVQDDLNQPRLLQNLQKGCKANRSFCYKIYFPGEFINLQTNETLEKLDIPPTKMIVIQIKEQKQDWVFFNKTKLLDAKCDNCKKFAKLNILCSCGYGCYCSKQCKSRDKSSHKIRCDRDAESSEQEKEQQLNAYSKKGKMGLRNLGNTCFMNSGIQCLTSVQPLRQYFLKSIHLIQVNKTNRLGTKGQLSDAYGKLIKKLWYGTEDSVAPSQLKRAIGKFQSMFEGYEQHDSGQLISYLLDGLHQDLNRIKEKPLVQTKDYDGRPDQIIAKQSWEGFLQRNQSIVVDLMYGQFRSRLDCPKCNQKSITFDPFLMCNLPIPQNNKKIFEFVLIKNHIKSIRYSVPFESNPNYKVSHIIDEISTKLGIKNNIIVTGSSNYSCEQIESQKQANQVRKDYKHKTIIMRQIQNHENLNTDQKIVIQHSQCHSQYGNQQYRRNITFQRIYLLNKKLTTKQIHHRLVQYYKDFINSQNYEKQIIDVEQKQQKLRILIVTNSKYDYCYFCEKKGCENCPLPYSDEITLGDLLKKIKKSTFEHKFQLQIYWRKDPSKIEKAFDVISSYQGQKSLKNEGGQITIYDCFKLFETPQILQEQNQWYCPKCKNFVLPKKQLKIYKAPKILIINLKRFKSKGYKGYFQSKLSTLIDFPIHQLDITDYVMNPQLPEQYFSTMQIQKTQKKPLKYELFAISNHYGSTGGGHYTAYCKKDNQGWHEYDDSHVSRISQEKLVSEGSYVLFFKRKT